MELEQFINMKDLQYTRLFKNMSTQLQLIDLSHIDSFI
jgi:hypothetical protein